MGFSLRQIAAKVTEDLESTDKRDPRADESIAMHAKPGTLGRGVGIVAVVALVGLSLRRKFFKHGYYARASPRAKNPSGGSPAKSKTPEKPFKVLLQPTLPL
eukprot:8801189-Pyramimonas_sp.AAC.1